MRASAAFRVGFAVCAAAVVVAGSALALRVALSDGRAAAFGGAGLTRVLPGCPGCGEPVAPCLRISREASSWLNRPRCV